MDGDVSQETLKVTNVAEQVKQRLAGRRKYVFHGGTLCSRCLKEPPAKSQCYCSKCHAARHREYRARATLARKGAE
jgi:hypothetical protein